MKPERAYELFMERLYGEITPEDDVALEAVLRINPELAREWEELRETYNFMHGRLAAEVPPTVEAAIRKAALHTPAAPRRLPWARFAAAASVLLVLGVAAMHFYSNPFWTYEEMAEVSILSPRQDAAQLPSGRSMQLPPAAEPDMDEFAMRAPAVEYGSDADAQDQQNQQALGMGKTQAAPDSDEVLEDNRRGREPIIGQLAARDQVVAAEETQQAREAEQLFRTALAVYNQAFAKIGNDRESLLRSAIVLLRDVDENFPRQREWGDMALLLIADAYQQLNETEAALQACLTLRERRPARDSLVLQAHSTAVEILIGERDWERARHELDSLLDHFPKESEPATLALTMALRLIDKQPEAALPWLNRLQEAWPPTHPIHVKANDLLSELIHQYGAAFAVRDWWVIGPLSLRVIYSDVIPEHSNNPPAPPARFVQFEGARYEWRRINISSQSGLDLFSIMERPAQYASAYLKTHVYSPVDKSIYLYCMDRPLMNAWLNGERMMDTFWHDNHPQAYPFTGVLPAGWSQLVVQTGYSPNSGADHWPVTVFFLDEHGRLATGLKIDAAPWEE